MVGSGADPRGILINAARTGFGQEPTFGEFAPGQLDMEDRLRFQIVGQSGQLRRAVEAEGMLGPWMEDERRAQADKARKEGGGAKL